MTTQPRLSAHDLTLSYGAVRISSGLSVAVPDNKVTVIIGPNACGKSTLLRALGRLLTPDSGKVILDGKEIRHIPSRDVARKLGVLPQTPIAPQGILVSDLVARGRTPHQSAFQQWTDADERAVMTALEVTGTLDLAERRIEELSGGQRQRVWIAMTLAQETDLLLLDEPTTFLDLAHQIDVLNLVRRLNRQQGRTVVLVLHDLNLACRYADHLIAMKDGAIIVQGNPADVMTAATVKTVFGLDSQIIPDPVTGTPMVVPAG